MFGEQDLTFDRQLEPFRAWLTGDPSNDKRWYREAHLMQALIVTDGLRDLIGAAVTYSARVGDGEPLAHLRYGVGRRAKMLWLSVRNLLRYCPPDRELPMTQEEVDETARDLNVIYINIRGLMDNLALAVVHQAGTDASRALPPGQIGLFQKGVANDEGLAPLAASLQPYRAWNTELSERRDPAAHRIPLSVTPKFLDPPAQQEWLARRAEYEVAMQRALAILADQEADPNEAFRSVQEATERMENVGRFMPLFHHHYDAGQYQIYPTVPEDLAMMLKVSARVFEFLDSIILTK